MVEVVAAVDREEDILMMGTGGRCKDKLGENYLKNDKKKINKC